MTEKPGGIYLILSVSRRTDIPAFYTDWFFNRLREGYVLVRNPMNYHQVSRVILSPDVTDCIVFWTKNPANMLDKLDLLRDYSYYFLVTINPYGSDIERNVPGKKHVIESFQKLSRMIGRKRTVWRYDPILFTDRIDPEYHRQCFDMMARELKDYTDCCIVSFLDMYKKSEMNMKNINVVPVNERYMTETAKMLAETASRYGLRIEACCEETDLSPFGIGRAKCIDDRLISEITGKNITAPKDRNQRDICRCAESIDIGAYNTCGHGCLYCYANYSDKAVRNSIKKHDPRSPMLVGNIEPGDRIYDRKAESYRNTQLGFL